MILKGGPDGGKVLQKRTFPIRLLRKAMESALDVRDQKGLIRDDWRSRLVTFDADAGTLKIVDDVGGFRFFLLPIS